MTQKLNRSVSSGDFTEISTKNEERGQPKNFKTTIGITGRQIKRKNVYFATEKSF